MNVYVYEGKFGQENLLFDPYDADNFILDITPRKSDFIFYHDEMYKILYCMLDADNDEYSVFVRKAVEEDY